MVGSWVFRGGKRAAAEPERAREAERAHERAVLDRAERVLDAGGVVLVDGRSGSGKTSLAARLLTGAGAGVGAIPGSAEAPRQVLRVEDLYPGWDGLAEGSAAVGATLETGRFRRYDWHAEAFAETHAIERGRPLVIEGCGAITRASLAAARAFSARGDCLAVWLDCPEEERRARALARDGETYAPHWDRWAHQERVHFGRHRPWDLADERLRCGG